MFKTDLSTNGPKYNNMIYILTEEYPQHCDITQLFKLLELPYDNINVRPVLEGNKWLGYYKTQNVFIHLMKGTGSLVDYLVFDTIDCPDPANDIPILAFEATKTDSSEAGNAIYQRLTKFIEIKHRWPGTRCVHYTSGIEKKKISHSQIQQRRLASTLGIELYDGNGDDLKCPIYQSVQELIDDRRNCNTCFVIQRSEHLYEINQPLTNGTKKGIDSDPGKGAVISVSNAIFELDPKAEFIVTGHGVNTENLTSCKNKFWSSTRRFSLQLEGCNLCSLNATERLEYCSLSTTGEKASSILFHMISSEDYKIVFHNHAGCGKSYLRVPGDKDIPLPKGGGFTYPDIVFIHEDTRTAFVIEAKDYKNVEMGDRQLSELQQFQELFEKHYQGYTLKKGLCVSAPTEWTPPNTQYPILFTLCDNGIFY